MADGLEEERHINFIHMIVDCFIVPLSQRRIVEAVQNHAAERIEIFNQLDKNTEEIVE